MCLRSSTLKSRITMIKNQRNTFSRKYFHISKQCYLSSSKACNMNTNCQTESLVGAIPSPEVAPLSSSPYAWAENRRTGQFCGVATGTRNRPVTPALTDIRSLQPFLAGTPSTDDSLPRLVSLNSEFNERLILPFGSI